MPSPNAEKKPYNPPPHIARKQAVRKRKRLFARKLRSEALPHTLILRTWCRFRPNGFKWRYEHLKQGYLLDFYCPKVKLCVELDSSYHDPVKDAARDKHLAKVGIHTIRFWWSDIHEKLPYVKKIILEALEARRP